MTLSKRLWKPQVLVSVKKKNSIFFTRNKCLWWKLLKSTRKKQNIYNILLINMTQSCQIKQIIHFTCILHLLNNTCVKHNFKGVHVHNLFWSREYNGAKEICKYPSFSKVAGNYPLDLKIIWSSACHQQLLRKMCIYVKCV